LFFCLIYRYIASFGLTKISARSQQPGGDTGYTTKGDALYAVALGWPGSGVLCLTAFAQDSAQAPGRNQARGGAGRSRPAFTRTRDGLDVRVPEGLAGASAIALKIRGNGLV